MATQLYATVPNPPSGFGSPFAVGVSALDAAGLVDSAYNSTLALSVQSGPGGLSGETSGVFASGLCILSPSLDVAGTYVLEARSGSMVATVTVVVPDDAPEITIPLAGRYQWVGPE